MNENIMREKMLVWQKKQVNWAKNGGESVEKK